MLSDFGTLGFDLDGGGPPPFRTGYYAPQGGGVIGTAAGRHCTGSALLRNDAGNLVNADGFEFTDVGGNPIQEMVRVDVPSLASLIDWNLNGVGDGIISQDINFDGVGGLITEPQLLQGSNDWAAIGLNQIGGGRSVGGWFFDGDGVYMGPMSLDMGRGDFGRGDFGRGDFGRGDFGRGDFGRGDFGLGDLGRGDFGRGDFGRGDFGRGDFGRGDFGQGDALGDGGLGQRAFVELTIEDVAAAGFGPPNTLTAAVIPTDFPCFGLPQASCLNHGIELNWTPPTVGTFVETTAYRADGLVAPTTADLLPVTALAPATTLVDNEEQTSGDKTYVVAAEFNDGTLSGPSNEATITNVNVAPVANDDSFPTLEDTVLIVNGVLDNDTDVDSLFLDALLAAGPMFGTLTTPLATDGSFTYEPNPDFFGVDSFTYTANDVDPTNANEATVDITITPVNDVPSFTKGPDDQVLEDSGPRTVPNWATNISVGPLNESGQVPDFIVSNDNNGLFSVQPAVSPSGTLTYNECVFEPGDPVPFRSPPETGKWP